MSSISTFYSDVSRALLSLPPPRVIQGAHWFATANSMASSHGEIFHVGSPTDLVSTHESQNICVGSGRQSETLQSRNRQGADNKTGLICLPPSPTVPISLCAPPFSVPCAQVSLRNHALTFAASHTPSTSLEMLQ